MIFMKQWKGYAKIHFAKLFYFFIGPRFLAAKIIGRKTKYSDLIFMKLIEFFQFIVLGSISTLAGKIYEQNFFAPKFFKAHHFSIIGFCLQSVKTFRRFYFFIVCTYINAHSCKL